MKQLNDWKNHNVKTDLKTNSRTDREPDSGDPTQPTTSGKRENKIGVKPCNTAAFREEGGTVGGGGGVDANADADRENADKS